ncbi:hypothetical protein FJ365_02785 [Candidatus Dependentiae bacterium]|nr:hypothetical protein [Candidatus Dependentiae bacterium]
MKKILRLAILTSMVSTSTSLSGADSFTHGIFSFLAMQEALHQVANEESLLQQLITQRVNNLLLQAPEEHREVLRPILTQELIMEMVGLPSDHGKRVFQDTKPKTFPRAAPQQAPRRNTSKLINKEHPQRMPDKPFQPRRNRSKR